MKLINIIALIFWLSASCIGQLPFTIEEMSPMPESVSNNAVCEGFVNGVPYVYSFTGIDASLSEPGIHLKAWRYNTQSDNWEVLDSVPDTRGKIAASANRIGDIIYIIGGYYVAANGTETSSSKVHRFQVSTNAFLADGMDIPVAIDDHVQAVWQDSLIYVVTGWSNTTNVPNVQIYNPSSDQWQVGTAVPNNNLYKVFGSSGTIVGDTLYYYGGARLGVNFPATFQLRKGAIDSNNPAQITWSIDTLDSQVDGYRMACTSINDSIFFIGGSTTTYNYDAVAYNGSGVVNPNKNIIMLSQMGNYAVDSSFSLPMDLRGIAKISPNELYLAGGILANGIQSDKLLKLTWRQQSSVGVQNLNEHVLSISPNPVSEFVQLNIEGEGIVEIYDLMGKRVLQHAGKRIDVSILEKGVYLLNAKVGERIFTQKMIKY